MNRPLLLISLCQFQFAFKKEYIRKIRKDMLLNIAWPCKFTCTIHIWHQTEQTICQLIKMYSFFFKRPMIAIFIPRNENASMWALILTVKEYYSFIQLLTSSSEKLYCNWFQVLRKFTWHYEVFPITSLVTPIVSSENINFKVMNGTFKWKAACRI